MAIYSRALPGNEELINTLKAGKASKSEMSAAAELIVQEMNRADKNADDLNYQKMKMQGAMEVVKVFSETRR